MLKYLNKFWWRTIIIIVSLLVVARLALPYFLLIYVEDQLNKIPEYKAKIERISVQLYRGSYTIHQLQLWKMKENIPVPFFAADTIDLSVQWPPLLKGKFVGEINFNQPIINFVSDPHGKNEQLSINQQWLEIVKSLFPLNFNKISITNGKIAFRSYSAKPPFNIYLKNVNMQIQNMQNADRREQLLPSTMQFTANTLDEGNVKSEGRFNPFTKQPTFDFKLTLTSMQIHALADFLKHFTNIDVKSGKFNLYVELVAAKGSIKGYAKPFIKDLKIGLPKNGNPIEALFDGAAALFSKIVENHQQETIATKIKIEGNIEDPDTSILSIIGYILRHAFIESLIPQIDHNVKMQDVLQLPTHRPASTHGQVETNR